MDKGSARPRNRFRALLRLHIRESFSQFKVGGARTSTTGTRLYVLSLLFFVMFGIIGSIAMFSFRALAPAYLVYFTLGYFVLLYLVTTNLTTVLITPEDADRILFRPIPAQEYFLSRYLTAGLMMAGWLVAYWLPMAIAHMWFALYLPLVAFSVALVFLGFSVFPSAFMIAGIAGRSQRTLLGYSPLDVVQILLSFVLLFTLGYTIRWITPTRETQSSILWSAPDNPWLLFLPPFWYLNVARLPIEALRAVHLAGVVLGFLLTFGGTALIFARWQALLMEMAHRRAAERTAPGRSPALIPEGWLKLWARDAKTRAVALVTLRYASRETRIRLPMITMAITSVFLVLFLLFIAPLPDANDPINRSLFSTIRVLEKMIYYLCLAFILLMQTYVLVLTHSSEHWDGSWVWWTLPLKPKFVRNAMFALVGAITLPIYGVLIVLILMRYGWDWRLMYEAMNFWLFSSLILQGVLVATDYVPFSRPSVGPLMDYWSILLVLLLPAIGYLGLGATTLYVKKSIVVAVGVPLALLIANLALYWWMERVPFKEQSLAEVP